MAACGISSVGYKRLIPAGHNTKKSIRQVESIP